MTKETVLKNQIKQYLDLKHYRHWHNLQGIGSYKGLPDRFVLHKGVLYGIEVKSPTGKLNENQQHFQMELKNNGGVPITARALEDVMMFLK